MSLPQEEINTSQNNGNSLDNEVAQAQSDREKEKAEGVKNRVQRATNNIQKIAKKIQMVMNGFLLVGKFIISPPGWISIITAFALLTFYSTSEIVGRQEFGAACSSLGSPILENIHVPKHRIKSTVQFFLENGFTKDQSAGLTAFIFRDAEKEEDVSKIKFDNQKVIEDRICDNGCLRGALDRNTLTQAGAFRLSGNAAKKLVEYAELHNQPWYKSEVQLAFIVTHIRKEIEEKNKDEIIKFNEKPKEYLQFVAKEMGSLLSGKVLDDLESKASEYAGMLDEKADEITSCRVLGDGTGEGRLGNSEIDADLDLTDVLKLAEQITTPNEMTVYTNQTYGEAYLDSNQYTKAYKEAKAVAMKNSEASTAKEAATVEPQPQIYASCDRFVATVFKATKADIDMPWGDVYAIRKYMKEKTEKYKPIPCDELKPGDILTFDGGTQEMQHIALLGEDKIYEASHKQFLATRSNNYIKCSGKDGTDHIGRKLEAFRLIKKGS